MALSLKLLLVTALCATYTCAHVCLIYPHQRGSMDDLNSVGAADCGLTEPPCGGRDPETPKVFFEWGENVSIVFQKNEDHYLQQSAGTFTISVAKYGEFDFQTLAEFSDTDQPSGTLYTPNVVVPRDFYDHAVLQLVYTTNNPAVPKAFYQCADLRIL